MTAKPDYIPDSVFKIAFDIVPEPYTDKIPPKDREDILLFRAHVKRFRYSEFCILASAKRPDLKKALQLASHLESVTSGLPCVICSPELDYHQRERIAASGVGFIIDDRNLFMPFLGMSAYAASREAQPKKLSPHAQRTVLNLILGTWQSLNAGELATQLQKSSASITNYLSEIAAISPSLVEVAGRSRILQNPGFSKEELFERFLPYLSSPLQRTFKITANVKFLQRYSELGFLLSGYSAIEAKKGQPISEEKVSFMTTEESLKAGREKNPRLLEELPLWHESNTEVQVWSYPIDWLDEKSVQHYGIGTVDDYSLYLSLKGTTEDMQVFETLKQIREKGNTS